MKIKCGECGIEDRGQHKKLRLKGWKIFFLGNSVKIARCKDCRPIHPEFYGEVRKGLDRIKIINRLLSYDEKMGIRRKVSRKRLWHYRRNKVKEIKANEEAKKRIDEIIHIGLGSKSMGDALVAESSSNQRYHI